MALISRLLKSWRQSVPFPARDTRRQYRHGGSSRFLSTEQFETRILLDGTGFADDRVILSLQDSADHGRILNTFPGSQMKPLGDYGLFLMTLPDGITPMRGVDTLRSIPNVNFVEPDWEVTPNSEVVPNDTQFGQQWGLQNVGQSVGGQAGTSGSDTDATLAWNTTTGTSSMIVAIVDTGIEIAHPDLAANIWVNTGEIPGNGTDDDSNGYIDDVNGYDFGSGDADPNPDAGQGNDHGTHVAGIVGAVGNNGQGVSGVNWNVKLMPVKIFGSGGGSFVSVLVDSLNYAVNMGAMVSNHSYNTGTGGPIQAHQLAIVNAQANGHVFVASAGNTGQDNDVIDHYPSDYPLDNVVAVAATNNQDVIASFSNTGSTTVHLGAPGVDINSTLFNGTYGLLDGTSMASPHVAGAVALLMGLRPDLTYQDILAAIFGGVDPLPSLTGTTVTGGRLNLINAINRLPVIPDPAPGVPDVVSPFGTIGQTAPLFIWTQAANAVSYELEVDNLTQQKPAFYKRSVTSTQHQAEFQFQEGDYQTRVRTVASNGEVSAWSTDIPFTIDIPLPGATVITRPQGDIGDSFPQFEWNASSGASTYSLWVTNFGTQERVIYKTAYNGTTYSHFNPLTDGTYRAWVKAFNALGESSAWSNFVEFTIDAPIPVAPKLTAPASPTTNTNPRFIWTAVDGAARYDLWVNNLATGKSQYIRKEDISKTTNYFDPPFMSQGDYVSWIRAANGNNEYSPWSASYSFSVDILPPETTKLTGPVGANGSKTIATVNPTFSWDAAVRAVRYELWVNNMTTGQAQIIRRSDITTTNYTSIANLTQGEYRAWVRGINSAGEVGEWSVAFVFTIDEPTPSVPSIIAPVANPAGSIETATPTFVWTSAVQAPLYELQVDNVDLKQTNVISVKGIAEEKYTIPNARRFGEYTYLARVRAYNTSGDVSDFSAPFRIRVDIAEPTVPVIIGPTGTSKDTTPQFAWRHTSTSSRYEILVRDLVRNESVVLNVSAFALNPQGTEAYYVLPNSKALAPSTYRFWIRSFNSLGQASSWSASQTFVISAQLEPELSAPSMASDELLLTSLLRPKVTSGKPHAASMVPRDKAADTPTTDSKRRDVAGFEPQEVAAVAQNTSEEELLIDAAMWMMADPAIFEIADAAGT